MIGWIVLGLFVAGIVIFLLSNSNSGNAEQRMSNAFVGFFGVILLGIAVLIVLGAGLWQLF